MHLSVPVTVALILDKGGRECLPLLASQCNGTIILIGAVQSSQSNTWAMREAVSLEGSGLILTTREPLRCLITSVH